MSDHNIGLPKIQSTCHGTTSKNHACLAYNEVINILVGMGRELENLILENTELLATK